ncbi:MAG TPA: class I SAM-dependent methyltransferase [Thermoleophilaceae bacterium]|jgi:SAM-dependent methyltransferase|nr:class I SAM-dependent methyltransferase [Thermoleophilaceae bacterium]
MEASVEQFKERARKTWAAGDFDEISKMILEVGKNVVRRSEIGSGMTVLDVACGTGNATIPAALAGGECTGLDLVPELLETGRRNAAQAGVEIEWVEGDAEALPFADNSFDRVISTFGVMFAPRHQIAADELARVCAAGGTICLACWTPSGLVGDMFKMVSSRMPAPPSYVSPPPLWGNEAHVRSLLEPHGLEVVCEEQIAVFRGDSVEKIVATMEEYFGPWKMAKAALGDGWPELRSELFDLYETNSEPTDEGQVGAFGTYLMTTAKKPA